MFKNLGLVASRQYQTEVLLLGQCSQQRIVVVRGVAVALRVYTFAKAVLLTQHAMRAGFLY